ncbi:hypothetical protein B0H14DRAFT_3522508 [Mycena olivaceomarginata]|nr:hypothetical protein B0H14DRAFT_3522508 [Mycena olivaceomarginata]
MIIQRVATSAARGDGRDLQRLETFIRTSSETQAIAALPAFYANLDPSSIPSVAQLETSLPPLLISIGKAVIALKNLGILTSLRSFPPDALLELWPRVWAWVEFLHNNRHYVHNGADISIDVKTYITWCLLLMNLQAHTPTHLLMVHHPGIQAVVTRAWILTVDVADQERDEVFAKAQFMFLLDPKNPVNLDQILDEVGGTFDDLAALAVRHLRKVIPRRAETTTFWSAIGTFLDDMEHKSVPFKDALLANGAVVALVNTIRGMNVDIHPIMPPMRSALLTILQRLLNYPPGYTAISEALDAGLLHVIAICGADPAVKNLLDVVSPSMVYYPVISHMEHCIRDVEALTAKICFRKASIYPAWKEFYALYERRLSTLKYFHSKPRVSLKACENLDCKTPIGPKSQFKRCSSCQTAHYCSSTCQTLDWKHGGHREICENLRSIRFCEPPLGARERGFLRVLLHEQYQKARPELLRQQSSASRSRPGVGLYTSFDYTAPQGDVTIKLRSILNAQRHAPTPDWAALWNYYTARLQRSQGTLELHLLEVMEGQQPRMRLFPMRMLGAQFA